MVSFFMHLANYSFLPILRVIGSVVRLAPENLAEKNLKKICDLFNNFLLLLPAEEKKTFEDRRKLIFLCSKT